MKIRALLVSVLLLVAASQQVLPAAGADCANPGSAVPVLFVHGFASGPSIFTQREPNLVTAVKAIPGTSVDVFSYEEVNSRWVTDPEIGQALAERIVCLADASSRGGGSGKVIVVAHSMGSLATRQAASLLVNGSPAGDRLGLVVTTVAPSEGSWVAGLAGKPPSGSLAKTVDALWFDTLAVACGAGPGGERQRPLRARRLRCRKAGRNGWRSGLAPGIR